ncbi:MAG: hypothetical protein RR446_10285 [Lachnospiraceae bacterium]
MDKAEEIIQGVDATLSMVVQKTELTKEQLIEKIVETISLKTEKEAINAEIFASNYTYITQKVLNDLKEINNRIVELRTLDQTVPAEKDYTHKKLRYFAEINKRAKAEIIEYLGNGIFKFLLDHHNGKFIDRQDCEFTNLRLSCCYSYGIYKRYYDFYYDFSTETKIRFIPGIKMENFLDVIKQYIDLKAENHDAYKEELHRMVTENKVLDYLYSRVEVHNVMSRRLEIFDTMKYLYKQEKWQSFIALAILQIEGLFFDCCNVLKVQDLSKTAGTFVEKVDKSFRDNDIIMLSVYPYFSFDVPDIRNEIAHTGYFLSENLNHVANELILDLNSVISWIYGISHEKYTILHMIEDKLDQSPDDSVEKKASTLLCEMLSYASIADYKYLDLLKNPTDFHKEIECMKTPTGYWENCIEKIMSIIRTEQFWNCLDEHIEDTYAYEVKPYNIVALADKLKNTFIATLEKNSPVKIACQKVAAKVKHCKENTII